MPSSRRWWRARLTYRIVPIIAVGALLPAGVGPAGAAATRQPRGTAPAPASAQASGEAVVKVMPLGDSITAGVGSTSLDGYRADLYDRLVGAGMNVDFVGSKRAGQGADRDHEGHPRWTIERVQAILRARLETYRPDVILLQLGTNNMNPVRRAAAGATKAMSTMLDTITTTLPDAHVFVAKIPSTATYGTAEMSTFQRNTDAFNAVLPGIVAGKGEHVHLVDQSTIRGIDLTDEVHPNDYGYRKMAWNWFRALEQVLGTSARPWRARSDPHTVPVSYRCIRRTTAPFARYAVGCHAWYRRTITSGGQTSTVWQVEARVTRKVRVKVDGAWVNRTVTSTSWVTGW